MIKKRLLTFALLVVLLFSYSAQAFAVSATGACAIDFMTGEILYAKNAEQQLVPASTTKIMTLYIIYEKIADGTIAKDTLIPISRNAATLSVDSEYTNIPLSAGENVSVETLIKAITTVSACASCTAIAEYLCGSEAEFAKLMNKTAAELGISAYFVDSSGISNYNKISPAGLAMLTAEFIRKHPDILNYTKLPSVWIKGKKYTSTNLLLSQNSSYYYSGADGFKTGTTNAAGKCLVATAQKDGARVVTVVMKAPSNSARYIDTIEILNTAFSKSGYKNNYLYSTDIKVFIDGYEIPCCYYLGNGSTLCIMAENLASFGFDLTYNADALHISDNPAKEIYTMVPGDDEPMTPMFKILERSSKKVIMETQSGNFPLYTVFSLYGQTAISADELAKIFPSHWDDDNRELHLYTPAA